MPKQQKTSTKKRAPNASKSKVVSQKPKNPRTPKASTKKTSVLPDNPNGLNKELEQKTPTPASTVEPRTLNFESLVHSIAEIHERLISQAAKAVNVSLTLRNWLIGCYIREYELGGSDRAVYGERLLEKLAERLCNHGIKRADERELRRYRQLYLAYPQTRKPLHKPWHVWSCLAQARRALLRRR